MKSKYLKILISLILVVSLCLAFTVAQSSAVPLPIIVGGGALAIGGITAALASAMGVQFDLSQYTTQSVGTAFDPWYSVQTTLTTSDFTLIKGLRTGYDALKLSLAAFNAIKEGSQNVIDDNNIQDNSTGTITNSTVFDVPIGIPFASIMPGQTITTPDGGTLTCDTAQYPTVSYTTNGAFNGNANTGNRFTTDFPIEFMYAKSGNNVIIQWKRNNIAEIRQLGQIYSTEQTADVTLDYTSGEVNISYGSGAIDNVTIVFPESSVLTPQTDLDLIMEYINNQAKTEDLEVEVDAVPPEPLPTDALGDIPFNQFVDIYGGSIFEKIDRQTDVIDNLGNSVLDGIDNQTDAIDTYGQSVVEGIENQTDVIDTAGQSVVTAVEDQTDVIDTVGQDVVEAIESVDTNIQTGTGILSGIRTLVDSAVDILEDIGEMVGELVEDIVLGTETLISGILNQIPSLFNVILSPIKRAASIWHYVVEWIQSIAGPFQFIWSMASGTSYYIVLPVYASLAAAVVLAFYKRFGK